jgi:glycine cleavage system H protein
MGEPELFTVGGFALALDRGYQPVTHMWVLARGRRRVRVGMDALGVETSGSLAQLSFAPAGTGLTAGQPFGQLEAAKFVGPLVSPISGVVLVVNDAVVTDAGLVQRDPYGAGWMIEASLTDDGLTDDGLAGEPLATASVELPDLLADPGEVTAWFAAKVADYRLKGLIAQ